MILYCSNCHKFYNSPALHHLGCHTYCFIGECVGNLLPGASPKIVHRNVRKHNYYSREQQNRSVFVEGCHQVHFFFYSIHQIQNDDDK